MPENFANRYTTTLAAGVTAGALTGTVTTATGAPAVPFRAIISAEGANTDEIVLVTGRTGTTLTWTRAAEAIAGVQAASAHVSGATFTAIVTAVGLLNASVFDVRAYGADPTGVAESTVAIELASLAAAAVKGTIYLPPGTFLVSWFENPDHAGYFAGVILRDGCSLRGAGIGATTIKLADSQASHVSANIVINHNMTGGDEDITIADLTVDGNGANQTTLYSGVNIWMARGARHERVRVRNVRGTASFPPGETFHITAAKSTDLFYADCEAIGAAGTHGSGFASNQCTNVTRVNCTSHGMSAGMGFTDWTSRGVLMANCTAQQNGSNGFNIEVCEDVTLANCRSGGRAASGADNYPHAANADLGNTGSGVAINASTNVLLTGCLSSYNGNNGVDHVNSSAARVVNSLLANNTGVGAYYDDTSLPLCYLAPSVKFGGNAYDGTFGSAIGSVNATHALASPAVPATGVAYTNPYPFEVVIYVVGGSLFFLMVDGAVTGLLTGTFTLKSGATIQMNYASAPSWTWFRQ